MGSIAHVESDLQNCSLGLQLQLVSMNRDQNCFCFVALRTSSFFSHIREQISADQTPPPAAAAHLDHMLGAGCCVSGGPLLPGTTPSGASVCR